MRRLLDTLMLLVLLITAMVLAVQDGFTYLLNKLEGK